LSGYHLRKDRQPAFIIFIGQGIFKEKKEQEWVEEPMF
jgi:hypothetical protein